MNAGAVLQRVVLRGTKYNDVFLAFAVVLIVSLMIIPVPPEVLDVLLATNLTGAVILIVTSMYIPSVLSFSHQGRGRLSKCLRPPIRRSPLS